MISINKIHESHFQNLKQEGYTIVRGYHDHSKDLDILSELMDSSFNRQTLLRKQLNHDMKSDGVAFHVLAENPQYLNFFEILVKKGLFQDLKENFFKANCILNSFTALNNVPNEPNFSSIIHRDLRFYSGEFPVMVNCLLMVDDFTIENGATYLLPKSHLVEDKPTDEYFYKNAIQATGKRGDLIIFDSNVFHASAPNKTNQNRRALPITISRSFMKQLLDYPRAITTELGMSMYSFSKEVQQALGYHSRVPSNLIEWYNPEETRLYLKNQD
jgi:ectoine hydroxylase-related dioxygenase (phytanoyl-CoA dioxygenase family)